MFAKLLTNHWEILSRTHNMHRTWKTESMVFGPFLTTSTSRMLISEISLVIDMVHAHISRPIYIYTCEPLHFSQAQNDDEEKCKFQPTRNVLNANLSYDMCIKWLWYYFKIYDAQVPVPLLLPPLLLSPSNKWREKSRTFCVCVSQVRKCKVVSNYPFNLPLSEILA